MDLAIVVLLVVYAVASIVSLWRSPYLLALLLLPAPLVLVARLGRSGLALAATGAVLGPATEIACVQGGLWTYAETGGLPFVPPWLIVIWACFPTALWLIVRSLLGSIPASKRGTLPLALLGIAIEVVLFVTLSRSTLLVIIAGLILAAAVLVIRMGEVHDNPHGGRCSSRPGLRGPSRGRKAPGPTPRPRFWACPSGCPWPMHCLQR